MGLFVQITQLQYHLKNRRPVCALDSHEDWAHLLCHSRQLLGYRLIINFLVPPPWKASTSEITRPPKTESWLRWTLRTDVGRHGSKATLAGVSIYFFLLLMKLTLTLSDRCSYVEGFADMTLGTLLLQCLVPTWFGFEDVKPTPYIG